VQWYKESIKKYPTIQYSLQLVYSHFNYRKNVQLEGQPIFRGQHRWANTWNIWVLKSRKEYDALKFSWKFSSQPAVARMCVCILVNARLLEIPLLIEVYTRCLGWKHLY